MNHATTIPSVFVAGALTLAATASPARAEDAYIESDGSQFINTGYHVKPESRIELDFAFVDFASTAEYAQARLFDNDANNSKPSISASVYVSGEYSLAACIGDCDATYNFAGVWTVNSGEGTRGAYCDATKRTIVLDEFGKRIALKEDGEEVWFNDQSSARQFTPLLLFYPFTFLPFSLSAFPTRMMMERGPTSTSCWLSTRGSLPGSKISSGDGMPVLANTCQAMPSGS